MEPAVDLLATPAFSPPTWPLVTPDLLMGYVGAVMVVRIGGGLSDHDLASYFVEWKRGVDARPADASVYAMYDIFEWPGMNAVQRREWAAMLRSREDILRKTTRGMVLASPSTLTRGAARAIFWLAPPPYPYSVVATPRAAFEAIAQRGGPPAAATLEAYDAFVKKHWRGAK
jgi:hypothetical protein